MQDFRQNQIPLNILIRWWHRRYLLIEWFVSELGCSKCSQWFTWHLNFSPESLIKNLSGLCFICDPHRGGSQVSLVVEVNQKVVGWVQVVLIDFDRQENKGSPGEYYRGHWIGLVRPWRMEILYLLLAFIKLVVTLDVSSCVSWDHEDSIANIFSYEIIFKKLYFYLKKASISLN